MTEPTDSAASGTRHPNVLAAVDDTPASDRAAQAAAQRAAADDGSRLVLFHVMPTIPTQYLEFGGRSDPEEERKGLERLDEERREWMERKAVEEAAPLLERFAGVARASGVPDVRIATHYDAPNPECSVAREILRVAREHDCGAVFVGRNAYPWHKEVFHTHVGEELLERAEDESTPMEVSIVGE